ncbi:2-amino-4-hydroxy-6-hydroxymethyldihydropteridine diphosphokinase [Aurantiacibacter spongiae]|uniref:2-amino-4-hydroxy-6-hydroxymethyldihydropteridine pyrophosphokinase n=1 Tax=Aurantiacibacter spongiae TaxID=2488860 RepID=A0A3N5CU05_9SPHN|nr:2-amino-4-hydroxy-6-hydroxymethyldihydropteridine diphosphokinase [Aurantiacibacter spongiae]
MSAPRFLIALGSNCRLPDIGLPRAVVAHAMDRLEETAGQVVARSPIIDSRPVGPSRRTFANSAVVIESELAPPAMLALLQDLEVQMGRKRRGQRWGPRTLDLDIVLWSGGLHASPGLRIPHPLFGQRFFVTGPAAAIAPDWRDPATGLSVAQINSRLSKPR